MWIKDMITQDELAWYNVKSGVQTDAVRSGIYSNMNENDFYNKFELTNDQSKWF